ncbi:MAG: tRNA pseudouridine(55) synthase TruB [Gemmatimonadetes bacterium]|nr:tRNA pseudouridine(55) synthase TruB [Gemmatimonadota bacterium]
MRTADGDYVLPVDKPEGPTSHDVVAMARRGLGTRRVGHTGTLDPFASGLLVLCVGRATRLAEYLSGLDKRYAAEARLGVSTDTLDREGELIEEDDGWKTVKIEAVEAALRTLEGRIQQVPPQYSAKKVGGEAMHRKARRGESVDLAPVAVDVYELQLLRFEPPTVTFGVHCSTGTYVRALARDLGKALGVGAHLTALRRTSVGPFDLEDAVEANDLGQADAVEASRVSPLAALSHLPTLQVADDVAARVRHGQRVRMGTPGVGADALPVDAVAGSAARLVAVAHADDLVAVGRLEDGVLKPAKVFPA